MAKLSDINLLKVGNTIQITGVIYEGDGQCFMCTFPGEGDSQNVLQRLDMDIDDWQKFLRQTDMMETEILTKAANGDITKAIVRKCQRQIDQHVSWKVFKRDQYRCRYCGNGDVPLTVDHIICWEEGGPSTLENMLSSCKKCNKTRGNTSYADWLQHPRYRNVSSSLDETTKKANEDIVGRLDKIPRVFHVRSR